MGLKMKNGTLTIFNAQGGAAKLFADPELTIEIEQPIFLNEDGRVGQIYLKKHDRPQPDGQSVDNPDLTFFRE